MANLSLVAVLCLTVLYFLRKLFTSTRIPSGLKPVPGPRGKWFVGNALDVPPFHFWLKFKEWSDVWGPIYSLSIFGKTHIVVSTERVANALLREKGAIYSCREQLPFAVQLLTRGYNALLRPYGEGWRSMRRFMHQAIQINEAIRYQPIQLYEVKRLVADLLRAPEKYELWFERFSGGVFLQICYGKISRTGEEPFLRDSIEVVHTLERVASPGAYLVDTFPFLMYLPEWLAPFKREGNRLHQRELKFYTGLLDDVRREVQQGTAGRTIAVNMLECQEQLGFSDIEAAYTLGAMYIAAAGTTSATMMSFCLAMCHFPQWQERLQEEVDRVVGEERMPNFEDSPDLPLTRAIIKEVMRLWPVTAGGFPHRLTQDDSFEGYFIPEGTNVHANTWAIQRDPEMYPDPESFRPERWLEPSFPTYKAPLTKYPTIQNYSSFGFGRRICPGMNIAERSLFIEVATIAWSCTLSRKVDSNGKQIPLAWYDFTTGFNVQPKTFPFDIKPRSAAKAKFVADSWTEACNSNEKEISQL